MNWQPVDCHAHSIWSDGALTIDQIVERAVVLGVQPSVTDHVSRDVQRSIQSVDDVVRYLDALEAFDVLRGAEFCWHDGLWRELPPEIVARFTHRVGSLHAIRLPDGQWVHAFSRKLPDGLTPASYMEAHLATLQDFAREMPVDVLAHPTLVTLPYRALDTDELWTDEHEAAMVDALFAGGIAFEISSRYPPHERLVRRAVDRGVRISLGSDGHTAEQVADIRRPLALARSLGVPDEALYDPRRHGSRTGNRSVQRG
jgi:histidinol phosphatase-like PHP family hydrolase